jgi:hypothetical protein
MAYDYVGGKVGGFVWLEVWFVADIRRTTRNLVVFWSIGAVAVIFEFVAVQKLDRALRRRWLGSETAGRSDLGSPL